MKRMFLTLLAVLPLLTACFDFEETPYALLALDSAEAISPDGGEAFVHIYANYPWTLTTESEGLDIDPLKGEGGKETIVRVKVPSTESEKDQNYMISCSVTSTSGDQYSTYMIVIVQKGRKSTE